MTSQKRKCDHEYSLVNTAITFALNRVIGRAPGELVDRLTHEFFAVVGEFEREMRARVLAAEEMLASDDGVLM